jgi:aspartate 1-decarboxylase
MAVATGAGLEDAGSLTLDRDLVERTGVWPGM